jgi:hypothetical protein
VNPAVKINEAILQSRFILLPPDTIDSRRSLTLESVEAVTQKCDGEVVEQGSEPFLFPFPCCFSHTVQPLGHAVPALCREHAWLTDVHLHLRPSLPHLRRSYCCFVRQVHRYYGTVRLLQHVHVRRSA